MSTQTHRGPVQPFRGTEPRRAAGFDPEIERPAILRSTTLPRTAAEVPTDPKPSPVKPVVRAAPETQASVYAEMERAAQKFAEPGESTAAALDYFLMTPEGGQMYERYQAAPSAPIMAAEPLVRVRSVRECIADGFTEDARKLMAREPGLAYAVALSRVVAKDPQTYTEYRRLVARGQ